MLRAVITGANTGVGRAIAIGLIARGDEVVLACRSRDRGREALAALRALAPRGSIDLVQLDLADARSILAAAEHLATRPIDLLINNAGVGGARGSTRDGFELAFGVNFLGHYLLTRTLLPALRGAARIVHLGSGSHARAPRPDLRTVRGPTRSLTGVREYAISKLCVMLFHHELARRLEGSPVISIAADPGDVASDAWRHLPSPIRAIWTRGMKAPEEGARTPLFCALDPSITSANGALYAESQRVEPAPLALDRALARELWDASAAWTGLAP